MPMPVRVVVLALVAAVSCGAVLGARQTVLPAAVRAAADGISGEQLAWDAAQLASDEW